MRAPHHDTPDCEACKGPLVPLDSGANPANPDTDPLHVRCAACGEDFQLDPAKPDDLRRLARIWWSAGAYVGIEFAAAHPGRV